MKRGKMMVLAAVAFGLLGGGSGVCSTARAGPELIWSKRFPDLVPVQGAQEYSVGVAASATLIYSGGMSVQSTSFPPGLSGSQQFGVTQHDRDSGTVLREAHWPPTYRGDPDIRTVKDMVTFTTGDTANLWLAGHMPDINGRQRLATVEFIGNPTSLNVGWSRFEDTGSDASEEYAVGASVGIYGGTPTPTLFAIVGKSVIVGADGSSVRAHTYIAATGKAAKKLTWHSTPTSTDVPVGIAVLAGGGVIIAGTTDKVPTSSLTYKRLFVLAFDSVGQHIAGSPLIIDGGLGTPTYDLEAAASATAQLSVGGTTSLTAVVATRTWTSGPNAGRKEVLTYTFVVDGATPTLHENWGQPGVWDGSLSPDGQTNINVPTCVAVAGFPPSGGDIRSPFHVFVGGTVQVNASSKKEMVVMQWNNNLAPALEWFDVWRRYQTPGVGDNIPAQIRYSENPIPGGSMRRIYVVGRTQNTTPDLDMVTIKYGTENLSGQLRDPTWGRYNNPIWAGPFGDDSGVSVFPAPFIEAPLINFFITGPSYGGATTNDDWVINRYRDDFP